MAKSKVIYPEIEVRLHQGKDALTVEDMKELLGWTEEPEPFEGRFYNWGPVQSLPNPVQAGGDVIDGEEDRFP